MELSKQRYKKMYEKASPKSKVLRDVAVAYCVGGLFCTLGQLLSELFLRIPGVSIPDARMLTTFSLILLSGILTGIGVYDKLSRRAGAGTLVPITGFANSVVAPAMEFRSEGYVLGVGAKMFIVSGPVIVYGTAASVVAGLVCKLLGIL